MVDRFDLIEDILELWKMSHNEAVVTGFSGGDAYDEFEDGKAMGFKVVLELLGVTLEEED